MTTMPRKFENHRGYCVVCGCPCIGERCKIHKFDWERTHHFNKKYNKCCFILPNGEKCNKSCVEEKCKKHKGRHRGKCQFIISETGKECERECNYVKNGEPSYCFLHKTPEERVHYKPRQEWKCQQCGRGCGSQRRYCFRCSPIHRKQQKKFDMSEKVKQLPLPIQEMYQDAKMLGFHGRGISETTLSKYIKDRCREIRFNILKRFVLQKWKNIMMKKLPVMEVKNAD